MEISSSLLFFKNKIIWTNFFSIWESRTCKFPNQTIPQCPSPKPPLKVKTSNGHLFFWLLIYIIPFKTSYLKTRTQTCSASSLLLSFYFFSFVVLCFHWVNSVSYKYGCLRIRISKHLPFYFSAWNLFSLLILHQSLLSNLFLWKLLNLPFQLPGISLLPSVLLFRLQVPLSPRSDSPEPLCLIPTLTATLSRRSSTVITVTYLKMFLTWQTIFLVFLYVFLYQYIIIVQIIWNNVYVLCTYVVVDCLILLLFDFWLMGGTGRDTESLDPAFWK